MKKMNWHELRAINWQEGSVMDQEVDSKEKMMRTEVSDY